MPKTNASKLKIAVLASGRGSNFQAILEAIKAGKCNAEVALFITNNPNSAAIEIVKNAHIETKILEPKTFSSRDLFELEIKRLLDEKHIQLVVLAGFMLLLTNKSLLQAYKYKIINIHPSLLPSFPGKDAQKQAMAYGAKVSGVTIHFVDEGMDTGPIIFQQAVDISLCKNEKEISDKILNLEHDSYWRIINNFSKGRYIVNGRYVRFEE